jgi:superfamily I DNA/RNA helicase
MLERLCATFRGVTPWDCDYYFEGDEYRLGCADTWKHDAINQVLAAYFRELVDTRRIDFELILWYSQVLIRSQPHIAALLSQVFSYVVVDEYQDTKRIQYDLVGAILRAGAGSTKTFIVGDPNQAIYGSLGGYAISVADFRALTGLPIREMVLRLNYRSSTKIIGHFSNFSVHATEIEGAGKMIGYPSQVSYNQLVAHADLSNELVRLIQKSLAEGHAPEEICVLAPWWILLASTTRKLVALLPEQQFDGPGLVPFSNDPDNFWFKLSKILLTESSPQMLVRRMRWARDVIADLRDLGVDTSRITERALLRESNSLSITEVDGLAYLDKAFLALLDRLRINLNSFPGLLEHREAFFASSQARLERLQNSGAAYITDLSFFQKVFRERSGITVSTIHGVKGAEFDVVIAFGLLQGMVPHFSDADGDVAASKLLYVLASRARKNLHLISERGRSRGRRGDYEPTEALLRCRFDYSEY